MRGTATASLNRLPKPSTPTHHRPHPAPCQCMTLSKVKAEGLDLIGVTPALPVGCREITPDFKCARCGTGYTLTEQNRVRQARRLSSRDAHACECKLEGRGAGLCRPCLSLAAAGQGAASAHSRPCRPPPPPLAPPPPRPLRIRFDAPPFPLSASSMVLWATAAAARRQGWRTASTAPDAPETRPADGCAPSARGAAAPTPLEPAPSTANGCECPAVNLPPSRGTLAAAQHPRSLCAKCASCARHQAAALPALQTPLAATAPRRHPPPKPLAPPQLRYRLLGVHGDKLHQGGSRVREWAALRAARWLSAGNLR
jgi:hypothetical protein